MAADDLALVLRALGIGLAIESRTVFLTLDVDVTAEMWLCRDYLPEIVEHDREMFPTIAHLGDALPKARVETIPVPAVAATWRAASGTAATAPCEPKPPSTSASAW